MTLNIGVIGTGNIGRDHIRRLTAVTAGASVTAVTDIDAGRARAVAGDVGARALPTGREVIEDDAVDAVLVASWGPTHEEYVLASIAAGKHVFCEKPLTTTADGGLRIMEAETAHGGRLVRVGFMRRYDPAYRAMRHALAGGRLGAPLMVHCAHRNPDVPGHYETAMAINDTAVHEIDVLRWLLGEEFAAARVLRPRRSRNAREGLVDPHLVLLETASGVLADVEVYVNCRYGYDIRCEVVAENGTVALADPGPVAVRHADAVSTAVPGDWRERFAAAYDLEIQTWVDGVTAGRVTGPSSWDGYAATVVADACLESQASGERALITLKDMPGLYRTGDGE